LTAGPGKGKKKNNLFILRGEKRAKPNRFDAQGHGGRTGSQAQQAKHKGHKDQTPGLKKKNVIKEAIGGSAEKSNPGPEQK